MRLLLFIVLFLSLSVAVPLFGALVFQAGAEVMQLAPTIDSVRPHVQHVFVCQPEHSNREMEGYMGEWSRHTKIPSMIHKGTRNACLRVYESLAPPSILTVLLVEWNMRFHVNGTIPHVRHLDEDADYALAPDQSGQVLDWTPLAMNVGARCGYMGRFVCVGTDVAHRHLMQLEYELDVDKDTRELIERDMISIRRYPPPVLVNVLIIRQPPRVASSKAVPMDPPSDFHFGYAWYWMGKECEAQLQGEQARNAYVQRLQSSGDSGDMWYALYRLGDTDPDPAAAVRTLLEAYNMQPRRREPLAALMRRYADEDKYAMCHLFGAAAMTIPFPSGPQAGPHVEIPIYEWMVADELSLCLARLGHPGEAARLVEQLLNGSSLTTLPQEQRTRIQENLLVWKTAATGKEKVPS